MYQRALDEKMFKDFQEGGVLHDLLDYVQSDDTLDLLSWWQSLLH